tara:strand:- start:1246 stop:1734 length:489 start_codon:yes stop_codon:yes gene_type:complete
MLILESYLKNIKVQKALNTKPGEEGFSLVELVVVIAVLAILSAVAIPAFVGVQANARASAVKNGLVNGVKECVVKAADNSATTFNQAQSFATAGAFRGFTIGQFGGTGGGNTCYAAQATTTDVNANATFTIVMDPTTGVVTRGCSENARAGCDGSGGGAGTW